MSPSPRPGLMHEEEPDNWDKAVNAGGCVKENEALLNCKADSGDWRKCSAEVNQSSIVLKLQTDLTDINR